MTFEQNRALRMMSSACLFAAAIRIKSNSCKYYLVVRSLSDDCPSMLWFPIVTHYHITIVRRSHPSKLGAQDHTTNFLLDFATSLQINFFLPIIFKPSFDYSAHLKSHSFSPTKGLSRLQNTFGKFMSFAILLLEYASFCHESIKVFAQMIND